MLWTLEMATRRPEESACYELKSADPSFPNELQSVTKAFIGSTSMRGGKWNEKAAYATGQIRANAILVLDVWSCIGPRRWFVSSASWSCFSLASAIDMRCQMPITKCSCMDASLVVFARTKKRGKPAAKTQT